MEPIKPKNVIKTVPSEIIEAFNELISEKWNGKYSTILVKDVVRRIKEKLPDCDPCEKGYLDIEDIYRKVGWKVKYDAPGYNETYDAIYTFSK